MDYMQEAIKQAKIAERRGEVPIGCVIVKDGKIIDVMAFSTLDKKYSLQDTDQLYKKDKLFAEKIDGEWYLV